MLWLKMTLCCFLTSVKKQQRGYEYIVIHTCTLCSQSVCVVTAVNNGGGLQENVAEEEFCEFQKHNLNLTDHGCLTMNGWYSG